MSKNNTSDDLFSQSRVCVCGNDYNNCTNDIKNCPEFKMHRDSVEKKIASKIKSK